MEQEATVMRVFSNGTAEITVQRKTACGGSDCEHCHGCIHPEGIVTVAANNQASAVQGDRVKVESSTKKVLGAAVIMYVVPIILMVAGYFLVRAAEGVRILCSMLGLLAGVAFCFVCYRYLPLKKSISFTITDVLR